MIFQRRNKLLYKLLIFVLPFVVLSVVGTGILLSMTSYTFFERTINQNYRNILKSSAGEIQFFMGNARQNMDSLAQLIAELGPLLDRLQALRFRLAPQTRAAVLKLAGEGP